MLGGYFNATGSVDYDSTISGGENNSTSANGTSVLGGLGNDPSSGCQAIPAAPIGGFPPCF